MQGLLLAAWMRVARAEGPFTCPGGPPGRMSSVLVLVPRL
jgi:hypothetical protein